MRLDGFAIRDLFDEDGVCLGIRSAHCRVCWKGYPESSWEPLTNLESCVPEMVRELLVRQGVRKEMARERFKFPNHPFWERLLDMEEEEEEEEKEEGTEKEDEEEEEEEEEEVMKDLVGSDDEEEENGKKDMSGEEKEDEEREEEDEEREEEEEEEREEEEESDEEERDWEKEKKEDLLRSEFSKEEIKMCVEKGRNVYGEVYNEEGKKCDYSSAWKGRLKQDVLKPKPVCWRRRKERKDDSDTDVDTDDEGAFFRGWDARPFENGGTRHVYGTPDVVKDAVPPVAFIRNGGLLIREEGLEKELLEAIATQLVPAGEPLVLNGAILMSCEGSLDLISEEFPETKKEIREMLKKHEVSATPQLIRVFDEYGCLPRTLSASSKTSVRMANGERIDHISLKTEPKKANDDQMPGDATDVFSVRRQGGGSHQEYWAPRGVAGSSRGLKLVSNKTKKIKSKHFVSRVIGEFRTDETVGGGKSDGDGDQSSNSDSSESDETEYRRMYQSDGTSFVSMGSEEWQKDIECGIVASSRVPLTGGATFVGRTTPDGKECVREDSCVVPLDIFLKMIVSEYTEFRSRILSRLCGKEDYIQAGCLIPAGPGKSDRVEKKKFKWVPTRQLQQACSWKNFEKNTTKWLDYCSGVRGCAARGRSAEHLRSIGLGNLHGARIDPRVLDECQRAMLIEGGVRTRQRCPEVGSAFVAFLLPAVVATVPAPLVPAPAAAPSPAAAPPPAPAPPPAAPTVPQEDAVGPTDKAPAAGHAKPVPSGGRTPKAKRTKASKDDKSRKKQRTEPIVSLLTQAKLIAQTPSLDKTVAKREKSKGGASHKVDLVTPANEAPRRVHFTDPPHVVSRVLSEVQSMTEGMPLTSFAIAHNAI